MEQLSPGALKVVLNAVLILSWCGFGNLVNGIAKRPVLNWPLCLTWTYVVVFFVGSVFIPAETPHQRGYVIGSMFGGIMFPLTFSVWYGRRWTRENRPEPITS